MAFEFSRNVLIGQYIPADTFVHRLDPRTKIVSATALLLAITFNQSLLAAVVYLLAVLAMVKLSQIPIAFVLRPFIRGLPVIIFFLSFSVLFMGWQEPAGVVIFEWRFIRITSNALLMAALSLVRLATILLLVSLPTLTTKITELTHGMEALLQPFSRVGLPAQDIALTATIALRFVPILTEELERVIKAQASRGGDIGVLSWRQPLQIARAIVPLVVPLFVNAFRRAEELAVAMEARCYMRGGQRTRLFQLQARWLDGVVAVGVVSFTVSIWLATRIYSLP
jgi:energy-coupling factor transport system permease protein